MHPEKFVKQRYPYAYSHKAKKPMGNCMVRYHVVRSNKRDVDLNNKLGEGESRYKAWVDAKNKIIKDGK